MCQRMTCARCGKPTFSGCGRHVEQVLGDVPLAERCQCGRRSAGSPAVEADAPLLRKIGQWFKSS